MHSFPYIHPLFFSLSLSTPYVSCSTWIPSLCFSLSCADPIWSLSPYQPPQVFILAFTMHLSFSTFTLSLTFTFTIPPSLNALIPRHHSLALRWPLRSQTTCTLKAATAFVFNCCYFYELTCVVFFLPRSCVNVFSEGTQSLSTF